MTATSARSVGHTVVILFADALSAPEVGWSLHDARHRVVAVARRGKPAALSHSRIIEVCEVTDPAMSVRRSLEELDALLRKHRDAIVMPLDDYAIWMVHHLTVLPARICGATGHAAAVTLDKRLQFEAAQRAGFSVPDTAAVDHVGDLGRVVGYPCIVKPALAARVIGDTLGRGRSFVLSRAEDARRCTISWDKREPMLAQPHLKGVGEGLFGLALDTKFVAWTAHRRVRMMNPDGSGSSACTNAMPDLESRAIAERFLRSLNWRGLFMIEFLREPNGKLWFMELNGRPWGSMALALRQGVDYPAWAVRAMSDPLFLPPAQESHGPLVCRHVARELIHVLYVVRGPGSSGRQDDWPKASTTVREMLRWSSRQALYNWRRNDPLVFVADIRQTLGAQIKLGQAVRRGLHEVAKRVSRKMQALQERRRQKKQRLLGVPASLIGQANNVLFVCYGNINRSALAETHLSQLIDTDLSIRSCGFHHEGNRAADPCMVDVARGKGISMAHWTSRTVDSALIRSADVIFAMEASHLVRLHAEYPDCRGRVYLLSCVTPPGTIPLEIRDPFGGSRSEYQRCLHEVTSATSALAALIASRNEGMWPRRVSAAPE